MERLFLRTAVQAGRLLKLCVRRMHISTLSSDGQITNINKFCDGNYFSKKLPFRIAIPEVPAAIATSNNKNSTRIDLPPLRISKLTEPNSKWQIGRQIKEPEFSHKSIIMEPVVQKSEMVLPGLQREEMFAHRMLVIRKRKMKVHQRKKRAKKLKFAWRKIVYQRWLRKETAFMDGLMLMLKQVEEFDPSKHIDLVFKELDAVPPENVLPPKWTLETHEREVMEQIEKMREEKRLLAAKKDVKK